MANLDLNLSPEELETIYTTLKNNNEGYPDWDHYDEYDEQEEAVDRKKLKTILEKIGKCLPKESREEIDKDFLRQKYHTYNNDIDQKVYRTLKAAFEQLRTVEIKYFDMNSAEFITRKLDTYYTSAKYTIGYCHLRNEMRKFRTSRIASAKLTDSMYKIPKSFNKHDY